MEARMQWDMDSYVVMQYENAIQRGVGTPGAAAVRASYSLTDSMTSARSTPSLQSVASELMRLLLRPFSK